MAQSNNHAAEQLCALAHELAEALTATKSYLRAAERLAVNLGLANYLPGAQLL